MLQDPLEENPSCTHIPLPRHTTAAQSNCMKDTWNGWGNKRSGTCPCYTAQRLPVAVSSSLILAHSTGPPKLPSQSCSPNQSLCSTGLQTQKDTGYPVCHKMDPQMLPPPPQPTNQPSAFFSLWVTKSHESVFLEPSAEGFRPPSPHICHSQSVLSKRQDGRTIHAKAGARST